MPTYFDSRIQINRHCPSWKHSLATDLICLFIGIEYSMILQFQIVFQWRCRHVMNMLDHYIKTIMIYIRVQMDRMGNLHKTYSIRSSYSTEAVCACAQFDGTWHGMLLDWLLIMIVRNHRRKTEYVFSTLGDNINGSL